MLRVGLTGGIGSGKSTVAERLCALGAAVSRSDEIARAMMQPGEPVYRRIVQAFGAGVVRQDGMLDRAELARLAFVEGRVEELNDIVHPSVIAAQTAWMNSVEQEGQVGIAVVESALLFETRYGGEGLAVGSAPWRTRFDRVVVVSATEALRRQRFVQRSAGLPVNVSVAHADEFNRRAAAQWPEERKVALADFVVVNNGSWTELDDKVKALYRTLREEAVDRAGEAM